MAVRPKILALANKITLEARTGRPNVPADPEYRILAEVVTDDQADVAMACRVRRSRSLAEIAERCGKSTDETRRLLWELASEGVVTVYTDPSDGEEAYVLPCWVPGIMEMMVGNREQAERHPEIPRCFEEYTRKNMRLMAPNLPVGMGVMRVIPVESAIKSDSEVKSYEELTPYIENAWKIAVTDCSCRRTRRVMGEGCGHLEQDMCIMLNRAADFQIKTGHGREITKREAYDILRRAEDNGLIHEVSNIDGTGTVSGICNCCECSCLSLRGGRLYNSTDMLRSNYHSEVDKDKCVACGQCVENCQMNAIKLGQKLCSAKPLPVRPSEKPDAAVWGKDKWNPGFRENRENVSDTGTAPCKVSCPAHIAVQGYIKLAAQGRYRDALELIKKENPFPAICGRVCPRFCEDACTRGGIDGPIAIDEIKKFIAAQDMKSESRFVPPMLNQTGRPFTEKIAVVGAGPAGLSCAFFLAEKGYPVTVFEKEKVLGGMMTLGIPEFRLEKDVVNSEIDVLREMGVEFRPGVEVGRDVTLAELRAEGYLAFYLAVGASKGEPVGCPGDGLRGVYTGIDFLRRINLGERPEVGGAVAVIGGGNVSIDVARAAVRLGADNVYIIYRRGRDEMKADAGEINAAVEEGVELRLLRAPAEITGAYGRVSGIRLEIMELGVTDASGRRSPAGTGRFEELPVTCVIGAVGQRVYMGGIDAGAVEFKKNGTIAAHALTFQTAQPDIFAGGDTVTGPKFVIDAIAAGKEAAISIHRFVHDGQTLTYGRDRREYRELERSAAAVSIGGFDDTPRQRPIDGPASAAGKTFRDLRGTFTEEQLKKETGRCLGCGAAVVDLTKCVGCGICTTKCRFEAVRLVRDGDYKSPRVENLAPYMIGGMARRGGKIAVKAVRKTAGSLIDAVKDI